jgi:hypothetical protein
MRDHCAFLVGGERRGQLLGKALTGAHRKTCGKNGKDCGVGLTGIWYRKEEEKRWQRWPSSMDSGHCKPADHGRPQMLRSAAKNGQN